jgi:chemotaxis protein MotB
MRRTEKPEGEGGGAVEDDAPDKTANLSEEELKEEIAQLEAENFEKAEAEIKQAIQETPELQELQKHLVIDQTPEGLRIQIVDQEGKPTFASGSSRVQESRGGQGSRAGKRPGTRSVLSA